jgi:uncharacterized OB-fold protein
MYEFNKKGHAILEAEASIPYELATGPTWWRYFEAFKEEKIFGTRCPRCNRVMVPAWTMCTDCFVEADEWVELSGEGEINGWSLTNYSYFGMPKEPPFVVAQMGLDGADTDFWHFIGGIDLKDMDLVTRTIKIGSRVRPVWRKEKQGCVYDIDYFEVI